MLVRERKWGGEVGVGAFRGETGCRSRSWAFAFIPTLPTLFLLSFPIPSCNLSGLSPNHPPIHLSIPSLSHFFLVTFLSIPSLLLSLGSCSIYLNMGLRECKGDPKPTRMLVLKFSAKAKGHCNSAYDLNKNTTAKRREKSVRFVFYNPS